MVNLATCRHTPGGAIYTTYSAHEIEAVAVYCGELDRCYLLPIQEIAGRRAFHLRLEAARNGQQACINLASDYAFPGAVAQLARASRWQREGRRFESDQLHDENSGIEEVGAERFGRHPARFLQRAAAGEEFLISRRGRPMARLSPVDNDPPPG